jgi:glyoxylase-like metal-dependent hydrolase (beta-lactamase superfamily II)
VSDLSFEVYLSPTRVMSGDSTFSPVSSTLFTGKTDAVLVDAQYYGDDVAALSDMIQRSGKRLTTIYITHGHSDHYFGAGEIAKRFNARIVALPSVVDYIHSNKERDIQSMRQMFGDRFVEPVVFPEPMGGAVVQIEDRTLHAIEIGQGDIPHSTVLHSPDLGVVVSGDIVYNGIHMMLAITGPSEWENWIKALRRSRH